MAKSGRRPPGDLRNTLGSLVASALEQVGVVREVVERGAQAQRTRYDSIRLDRRRREALASLGEVIYRLAVRGRLGPLADDPEVRAQLEEIDDLDQRRESAEQAGVSSFAANSGWQRGGPRRRHRSDDEGETRVWRPVPPFAAPAAHPDDELDDEPEPASAEPPARARAVPSVTGGGIRFGDDWDDDDLEEYMHEDDVPRPPAPEPVEAEAPEVEAEAKAPAKKRKRKPRKAKPKPAPE